MMMTTIMVIVIMVTIICMYPFLKCKSIHVPKCRSAEGFPVQILSERSPTVSSNALGVSRRYEIPGGTDTALVQANGAKLTVDRLITPGFLKMPYRSSAP